MNYRQLAAQFEERIIALRRDFHQHPELSYQEVRTSGVVCAELEKLGIPYVRLAENCVVGKLVGDRGKPGSPRLAIRADMDALPITEETTFDFASKNPGVMHACGHDGHTAMLLGAAMMLTEAKPRLEGTVYLCFQSAEEVGGGAKPIIQYLEDEGGVDRVIAAHLWADLPSGTIAVDEGARMANGDGFTITLTGRGGHASRPDLSIDPIKPLCQIVLGISAIPTNRIETLEPCVVHVGRMEAGTAGNIFPQTATVWGGFRTFSDKNRKKVPELIAEIAHHTALAYGATAKVDIHPDAPVVYNDPAAIALARKLLAEDPLFAPHPFPPLLASENFGFFLERFGGFMVFIGINNPEKGLTYAHHHPKFGIDEDVLARGAAFFAAYADAFLAGK